MIYVICVLALAWFLLRRFERANVYFPDTTITAHPGSYGIKYEDVWLNAADGPRVNGWYIERKPDDPVILMCHGNGGNISHRLELARIWRRAGASVFLFDYRGYGRSSGSPTEQGTYRDAEAAYDYLVKTRGIDPNRLIYYGESLGCAVALELALRRPPAGLILESGFTSIVDMGREVFPHFPVQWMVSFRYDNISKIGSLRCPALIMHSPQDDVVPYAMGRRLYEAAPSPKSFLEMKGGHNGGYLETGAAYEDAISGFLRAARARRPG